MSDLSKMSDEELVLDAIHPDTGNGKAAVYGAELLSRLANLRSENQRMREALAGIWAHVESGALVRDLSNDGKPDWSMKMIQFVNDMNKVVAALTPQPEGKL